VEHYRCGRRQRNYVHQAGVTKYQRKNAMKKKLNVALISSHPMDETDRVGCNFCAASSCLSLRNRGHIPYRVGWGGPTGVGFPRRRGTTRIHSGNCWGHRTSSHFVSVPSPSSHGQYCPGSPNRSLTLLLIPPSSFSSSSSLTPELLPSSPRSDSVLPWALANAARREGRSEARFSPQIV